MSDNSRLLAGSATKMYVSFHRAAHKDIRSLFLLLTNVRFAFAFVDVFIYVYARKVVKQAQARNVREQSSKGNTKRDEFCIFYLINYPLSGTDSSFLECLGVSISVFASATSRRTASSIGNS